MASSIKVTSNQLENAANELERYKKSLQAKKNDMDAKANQLAGQWEGEARDEFIRAYHSDSRQINAFIILIEQFISVLRLIANEYKIAEAKNKAAAMERKYR